MESLYNKLIIFSLVFVLGWIGFLGYKLNSTKNKEYGVDVADGSSVKVDYGLPVEKEIYEERVKVDNSNIKYSLDLEDNTKIKAISDGVVIGSMYSNNEGYADLMKMAIKQADGRYVNYSFYGFTNIEVGTEIKKGDVIGIMENAQEKKVQGGIANMEIMILGPDGSEPFVIEE